MLLQIKLREILSSAAEYSDEELHDLTHLSVPLLITVGGFLREPAVISKQHPEEVLHFFLFIL